MINKIKKSDIQRDGFNTTFGKHMKFIEILQSDDAIIMVCPVNTSDNLLTLNLRHREWKFKTWKNKM